MNIFEKIHRFLKEFHRFLKEVFGFVDEIFGFFGEICRYVLMKFKDFQSTFEHFFDSN